MDTAKGFYLDLEQDLYVLVSHYGKCTGASNKEAAEWAKFFLSWNQKAVKYCGSWSRECLLETEKMIQNLEKSKTVTGGYEDLGKAMAEASKNLNAEISDQLKDSFLAGKKAV